SPSAWAWDRPFLPSPGSPIRQVRIGWPSGHATPARRGAALKAHIARDRRLRACGGKIGGPGGTASLFKMAIRASGLVLVLLALPRLARADGPITDRNYTIDAYRGAAVADYRVVGMGGVSMATAEGAWGLLANPAAAASRPATASGWFYWDYLLDAYTPSLGADFDNHGT